MSIPVLDGGAAGTDYSLLDVLDGGASDTDYSSLTTLRGGYAVDFSRRRTTSMAGSMNAMTLNDTKNSVIVTETLNEVG